MAQVIRKYNGGGSYDNDPAPIQINGKWYDPDTFKREVMRLYNNYSRGMNLSDEESQLLR